MDEYRTKIFPRILRNKIGSLPHLPTHFPSKQTTLPTPPSSSSSSAAMAYNSIYQVTTMLQFSSLQRLLVPSHLASALDCLPDRCNLKLAAQKAIDLTVNIPNAFLTSPPHEHHHRHHHHRRHHHRHHYHHVHHNQLHHQHHHPQWQSTSPALSPLHLLPADLVTSTDGVQQQQPVASEVGACSGSPRNPAEPPLKPWRLQAVGSKPLCRPAGTFPQLRSASSGTESELLHVPPVTGTCLILIEQRILSTLHTDIF